LVGFKLLRLFLLGLLALELVALGSFGLSRLRELDSRSQEASAVEAPGISLSPPEQVPAEETAEAEPDLAAEPAPEPEPAGPTIEEIGAQELATTVPPEGISFGEDERWIAVNLSTQRAVAFVGAQPVRVALVTTGAPGWETPTGDFRIGLRKENETMDSLSIGIPHEDPQGYYVENVLFTQYFYGPISLHYNYWRPESYFGNVASSHGCVGMRYNDAKFFWDFATTGTRVVVYK